MSWIGVDLDGTLAHYDGWRGVDHIGEPVPEMLTRVKQWIAEGKCVKIFTARLHAHNVIDFTDSKPVDVITPIQEWCRKHVGVVLDATNVKDFEMVELWDDRCIQVEPNTGKRAYDAGWSDAMAYVNRGYRHDPKNQSPCATNQ